MSIEISVLGLRLLAHAYRDHGDVMMSCSSQRTFKHEIRRTNDGFSLPYKGVQLSSVTNTITRIFSCGLFDFRDLVLFALGQYRVRGSHGTP